MINAYYSKQFLHVFEKVAESVDCKADIHLMRKFIIQKAV